MKKFIYLAFIILGIAYSLEFGGCNYVSHRTVSRSSVGADDPDPDYNVSLNYEYQDFTSFMYMGNRSETFGTFFNKFFSAGEDYDEALKEYRTSTIATYNRRLDSLNITPPVQQSTKDKFTKVIERCSKIIQYNKNTRYFDQAVLLIGLSYFYSNDYLQAERKFDEFLSRLSKSEFTADALLYLGKTKFKLGKNSEAESILKNLLNNTNKDEIKSEIFQELAIYNLSRRNTQDAVSYFINSIDLTKDKEIKAERQFILAKIYSIHDIGKAAQEYNQAYKNTSNFDLEFYAKLNEAKVLLLQKRFGEADEILGKLNKKYIEYPDFKQLVELEIANKDFYTDNYKDARLKYFEVISAHPGGKAAAESYYKLGEYYEYVKKDFLKSLISYKKAYETSLALDYYELARKKSGIIDRYFTLTAVIHDTTKITIPDEEPDLVKYKLDYEERHNPGKREEIENPNKGLNEPKGGGFIGNDSIGSNEDSLSESGIIPENILKKIQNDSIPVPGDTTGLSKNIPGDTIKTPVVNEDSIKAAKNNLKLEAYFELAEIFYYDLKQSDSSIHYLNTIISNYDNPDWISKALFYLGSIYKSLGDTVKSSEYFARVIKDFPNSVYANESRKNLGLQIVEQSFDAADSLVTQAGMFFDSGNTDKMIPLLQEAVSRYPESPVIPKAIYTLGWTYENVYLSKDSAVKYYSRLKTEFPNSEYAKSVASRLEFYESLDKKDTVVKKNVENTADSLNTSNDSTNSGIPEVKDSLNVNPEQKLPVEEENKIPEKKPENNELIKPDEPPSKQSGEDG